MCEALYKNILMLTIWVQVKWDGFKEENLWLSAQHFIILSLVQPNIQYGLLSGTKNPPANAGDAGNQGSTPGLGRFPGGVHGNPLQYSCLENPMDRGAWQTLSADTTEAT